MDTTAAATGGHEDAEGGHDGIKGLRAEPVELERSWGPSRIPNPYPCGRFFARAMIAIGWFQAFFALLFLVNFIASLYGYQLRPTGAMAFNTLFSVLISYWTFPVAVGSLAIGYSTLALLDISNKLDRLK